MNATPKRAWARWLFICSPILAVGLGVPLLFVAPLAVVFVYPFLLPLLILIAFVATIREFKAGQFTSTQKWFVIILVVGCLGILAWCGFMLFVPSDVA